MILAKVVGGFCIIVILLAGAFRALDVLWDRQDKEVLKERVLEFWIRTSEIAFVEQLRRALEARYFRMCSLRLKFVKLFWVFCGLVALSAIYDAIGAEKGNLRPQYKEMIRIDFEYRYRIHCHYSMFGKSAEDIKSTCDADKRAAAPPELAIYQEREAGFQRLVSEAGAGFLSLSALASGLAIIAVVALPMTAALMISLNLTLWILSRITRSKLRFIFLVVLDVMVAIFMPPLLTSAFMLALVGMSVFIFGQILDFGSFSSATWLTLTLGTAGLAINMNFIFPALFFLLAMALPGAFAAIVSFLTLAVGTIWIASNSSFEFVSDVGKFLQLDFGVDVLQATINWAIFTDLLFSAFYLGPCLLLVIANRSERARKMFLNLVMWVGDHSKGPLVAFSEILSSIFVLFKKVFTGG